MLYGQSNLITIDCLTSVEMNSGVFQGLASSEVFYSTAKWKVTTNTIERCKNMSNDQFKVFMQLDYVDDGITMIDWTYLDLYLRNLTLEYKQAGVT